MRRATPIILAAIAAASCGGRAEAPPSQSAADPLADEVQNIRLVGHNDLQGRESLLVAVRSDEANGNWAYASSRSVSLVYDYKFDGSGRDYLIRNSEHGDDVKFQIAYFNAGVRLPDLSDPYNLREVGYYVPKPNERTHPVEKGQATAIQINDVDLDDRGLAYATDRTGAGFFILQRTGTSGRSGT